MGYWQNIINISQSEILEISQLVLRFVFIRVQQKVGKLLSVTFQLAIQNFVFFIFCSSVCRGLRYKPKLQKKGNIMFFRKLKVKVHQKVLKNMAVFTP